MFQNLLVMGNDVNDGDDICGEPADDQHSNSSPGSVTFNFPIGKVEDQEESLKKICHNITQTNANVEEKYFEHYKSPKCFHGPACVIVATKSTVTISILIDLKELQQRIDN